MTATFPAPSLAAQIAELKREQMMRRRVFPVLISRGTLKQSAADYQTKALDAAIATLERIQEERANG